MKKLPLYSPAPNVILSKLDGQPVPLANYWGNGHHLLLIFLRHLA